MKRTHWAAIAAIAAIASAVLLIVPSALASSPTLSRAFFADTDEGQLPDSAFARSSIMLLSNGAAAVQAELFNLVPHERWTVQVYDRGTCAAPRTFVAQFAPLTVNGGGTAAATWTLSPGQRALLKSALAARRSLALRVVHGRERACERYDAVDADFFEPRVPEPSFEPTARPIPAARAGRDAVQS
jgi:hypothetical protein